MILKPDENVWRVAKAKRAALLVDGADYFAALRRAMIKTQRSIVIAGWDTHSQTRLVGRSGKPEDAYPAGLAAFLAALVNEKPELDVCLLLWDFSVLYAPERDPFPTMTLAWNTPSRIRFCLDDCVPIGSSQHQKMVVRSVLSRVLGGRTRYRTFPSAFPLFRFDRIYCRPREVLIRSFIDRSARTARPSAGDRGFEIERGKAALSLVIPGRRLVANPESRTRGWRFVALDSGFTRCALGPE